jgi:hypothetical protein
MKCRDLEQHVAFHEPVGLDRHLDHPALHLRHDVDHVLITRTSLLDGAKTFNSRMRMVIPTTGMMTTITCSRVQGSHF